ncbi:MAG: hypothetical protein LBS74_06325 [Oscillospiraceae bacterium]|jgi:hypothetical protein|nr:hypothetical protein [Oscillospiraceae bacterium]
MKTPAEAKTNRLGRASFILGLINFLVLLVGGVSWFVLLIDKKPVSNGFELFLAIVMGISLTLLLFFAPFVFPLTSIASLVFGVLSLRTERPRRHAILGMIFSWFTFAISAEFIIYIVKAVYELLRPRYLFY